MHRILLITAALVMLAVRGPSATAFDAKGHKIVAAIAWQKMSTERRAQAVAILREHPRFDEDFQQAMIEEGDHGASFDEDQWIFCQAAIWPDIARGLPSEERDKYHRPRWHYINLPIFWDADQAQAFAGRVPANVSFDYPTDLSADGYNGVQAIKHSLGVIGSFESPREEQAVHYCWLLHSIADLHQPLHSAALFSVVLFPRGDKGGNEIQVRDGASGPSKNLHSYWDGLVGTSNDFDSVVDQASQAIREFSPDFNATFVGLPHDAWSTECLQVALAAAYAPLLRTLAAAEVAGDEPSSITLNRDYRRTSQTVARRQAVMAGSRLAGVLESIHDSQGPHFVIAGRPLGFPAAASRSTQPDRAAAGMLQGSLEEPTSARLHALETEVRSLRRELAWLQPLRPAERALSQSWLEGDGEQCTCGDDAHYEQ
jgi:hypothetical protein